MFDSIYRKKYAESRCSLLYKDTVKSCTKCGGLGSKQYKLEMKDLKKIKPTTIDRVFTDSYHDCSCMKEYKKYSNYTIAGLMSDQWDINSKLRADSNSAVWDKIKAYCGKLDEAVCKGYGLFLFGSQGVGKTAMLSYILNGAIDCGYDCFYIQMRELLTLIRKAYNKEDDENYRLQTGLIKEIENCQILVIDEIGKIPATDFVILEFESMLRKRINDHRPTLMASNFNLSEISDMYGKYTEDIIRGYCGIFELVGKSKRVRYIRSDKERFFD